MPIYNVKWDYSGCAGKLPGGRAVELSEAQAELINRDSWGVLELLVVLAPQEPEPPFQPEVIEPASELPSELEERAVEEAPRDRMARKPRGKRKA